MRALVLGALACLAAGPALAHGAADWIRDGGYRTVTGTTCCTEKDCGIIYPHAVVWESGHVRVTFERGGELIELRVPAAAVRPNPHDLDYWLCALPSEVAAGAARCLFIPMTAGR